MDTHVHAAPDVFGRSLDDEEVATLYKSRGLESLVLKNHVVPTADRAWFARKHVAGLKVFGGVVLNSPVGGINPDAVNWMWRMQGGFGRVVWFPTFDADNHVKHFKDAPEGIKVLDANGKVLPAVREVLKICAEQKLVVQTGHLSPSEALAVIEAGRDAGVDRMVVTHAQFEVVNMDFEQMKKAASMGAKLELCAMGPLMGPEAHGVDAALATSEGRGECRRSEGSWRRKLYTGDRSRSDGQSKPGRRAATVRHRSDEGRPD
ncbi:MULTISPECIES: DUF6282 family protein [unclassified Bradyrhizobium]|uniref:DUF6282 family protein n=1 Tax=unclassified Bradyrhizobium TaxID=2631580 RepID=UPI001FFA6182|nr:MULTISPECIES: DUF6282 family protein [unclassified Bradyrhizobium]MCK1708308.1 hypothetical protein [Bradyrhizobium sp. 143]MCK1724160.1 hypothetical protein [Bradyrhizobium sp. 142]